MNKTLIALAAAGLMAAPMAAQADATIYGKIHVSLDFGDTGGQDLDPYLASGTFFQSNSSRLGFKGSEDLGGGLKAVWQAESTIAVGSGTSGLTNRNTYVGLAGGWGRIIGGRHDTPMKTTGRKVELFPDYVGDTRNLIRNTQFGDDFDARVNNALMYTTPVFGGGWDINFMYTAEDGLKDNTVLSTNINWKTGNWFASLAYESHGKGALGATNDSSGIRLAAYWTPGAWKLTALYQTMSDVGGVSGQDNDAYGIGAAYKMGKNVLKAQYYVTSNKQLTAGAPSNDASMAAIGWDYNFSKRTTAYIAYAATSNDAGTYYFVDAPGHGAEIANVAGLTTTVAGDDPSAFSLGMIHKF